MASREYLEQLAKQLREKKIEVLEDESEFVNECVQCGNCCRDRDDILLTPFDLFHMVKATGKPVREIITRYGDCYIGDNSHLPLIRLRYREEPDGSTTCYFLGKKDGKFYCRIHDNKPGVCRTFPLGKFYGYQKDESESQDFIPKYFCQEYTPQDICPGRKLAEKLNIRKKVVDWVGGLEKKRLSDRYSTVFNKFMAEYNKALKFEKTKKRWNPLTQSLFFPLIAGKIYEDYDFNVDDDSFLDQMETNLSVVVELTKYLVANPNALIEIIAKDSQRNDETKADDVTA